MEILDPNQIKFQQNAAGHLEAEIPNRENPVEVCCVVCFPLTDPTHYISVKALTDEKDSEIGVLSDLSLLESSQQELVYNDIRKRFVVPEIKEIYSIRIRNDKECWTIATDRGTCSITVKDSRHNVTVKPEGRIFIVADDELSYTIQNFRDLPHKSRKELQKAVFLP